MNREIGAATHFQTLSPHFQKSHLSDYENLEIWKNCTRDFIISNRKRCIIKTIHRLNRNSGYARGDSL